MAKKILLIENDQALMTQLSVSLETTGFEVRTTGDGKEGLDLARDWSPEAIVLCVELPGMSGYLVCQKLKKDEGLKAIPLVLTSAEATAETFEKHRTLKARADDYLLKPYGADALTRKLGALVGLPEPSTDAAPPEAEEELVSLEEEIGLDLPVGADAPALDLESLPEEAAPEPATVLDEDLRLLDDAFDGLSAPPGPREAGAALDELTGETPITGEEVDAAAAALPEEDERAARADLHALDADDEAALGVLAGPDETLSPGLALRGDEPSAPGPGAPRVRGASADLLRAAGIKLLDDEEPSPERLLALVPQPEPARAGRGADVAELPLPGQRPDARDDELRELRRELDALERRAQDADAEAAQAKARLEPAQEKVRTLEEELAQLRKRSADADQRATEAERRAAEQERRAGDLERRTAAAEADGRRKLEEAAATAEALERQTDELRTELLVARGEADGARGEVEKRTADLAKRLAELEATNAKNEERVVKAYQKIKADEKVREKVRKALAIATQLLEEGLPAESPAEKERRVAAALGRE